VAWTPQQVSRSLVLMRVIELGLSELRERIARRLYAAPFTDFHSRRGAAA